MQVYPKNEITAMLERIDNHVFMIEIEADKTESIAAGFISEKAADSIDYDYDGSGLEEFIANILDDMTNESSDGTYVFKNLSIFMSRDIKSL